MLRRLSLFALLCGVLVWLAWQVLATLVADAAVPASPERALRWRPDDAPALVALADQRLAGDSGPADPAAVKTLSQRALAAEPLSIDAVRQLAVVAGRAGDDGKALALMELAASRSLRNQAVRIWLLNRSAEDRDYAGALRNADTLLRAWWPDARQVVFPVLGALALQPSALAPFVAFLSKDPPWRTDFLADFGGSHADSTVPGALFAALQKTAHPPTDEEIGPYLTNLVRSGRFVQAYWAWLSTLPPKATKSIPFVYNGDFESSPSASPFSWSTRSVRGVALDIVSGGPTHGHVLRVAFTGENVRVLPLNEVLLLSPGKYRLTFKARLMGLRSEKGLLWRITCISRRRPLIAQSDPIDGTSDWRESQVTFAVPPANCPAQRLSLDVAARGGRDVRKVSGEVWFDDIAVTQEPPDTVVTRPEE